jgi:hypothetical protein
MRTEGLAGDTPMYKVQILKLVEGGKNLLRTFIHIHTCSNTIHTLLLQHIEPPIFLPAIKDPQHVGMMRKGLRVQNIRLDVGWNVICLELADGVAWRGIKDFLDASILEEFA